MSIKVMSRVWEQSPQKGSPLLLTLALADNADDDGVCWPGEEYLRDKIRMDLRHTKRLLQHLQESGEIYRQVSCGRGNKTISVVLTALTPEQIADIFIRRLEMDEKGAKLSASSISEKRWHFVTKGDILRKKKVTFPTSENEPEGGTVSGQTPESSEGQPSLEPSLEPSIDSAAEAAPSIPPEKSSPSKQNSKPSPSVPAVSSPVAPEGHIVTAGSSCYHFARIGEQKTRCGKEAKDGTISAKATECKSCRAIITEEPFINALATVCYGSADNLTSSNFNDLRKTLYEIRPVTPDITPTLITKSFDQWWYAESWKGKKNERPKPHDIRAEWANFLSYKEGDHANGNKTATSSFRGGESVLGGSQPATDFKLPEGWGGRPRSTSV